MALKSEQGPAPDPRAALADELLPCPFCGGKAAMCVLEDSPGDIISAWVNCSCGMETHERRTEAEAAEKWNTRSPSPFSGAAKLEAAEKLAKRVLAYLELNGSPPSSDMECDCELYFLATDFLDAPTTLPRDAERAICATPPEDLLDLADAIEEARNAYLDAISRGPGGEVEKRTLQEALWNDKGTFAPALRLAASKAIPRDAERET